MEECTLSVGDITLDGKTVTFKKLIAMEKSQRRALRRQIAREKRDMKQYQRLVLQNKGLRATLRELQGIAAL